MGPWEELGAAGIERTRDVREDGMQMLTRCCAQLTPFVTKEIKKIRDTFAHVESKNSLDGKSYLEKWKEEGGAI